MSRNRSFLFLLPILAFTLGGCSKDSDMEPMVRALEQKRIKDAQEPVRGPDGEVVVPGKGVDSVTTRMTLKKSAILNRTFLYSASLQFSSIVEDEIATAMMGISLTALPANFRIVDNKLRLESDDSINFESDVNHPSRLILELQIVEQNADAVTVIADRASPVLGTFLFGKSMKNPRYSHIRSMEFVDSSELFLIESTIEMEEGGSRGAFMESIQPREKVVPADFKPIYNDEELSPEAARFRFLDSGDVYITKKPGVRVKTKVANRFLQKNGEPIKWYLYSASRDVSDKYITDIKNSVEAWNRYSRAAGKPDLVRFEGYLPEGVKVGDPRYNTIVWDTVQEAGAAYESQNADPISGIQTHSMIYIPLAWVNIGKDYWNKMTPGSQEPGGAEEQRAAKAARAAKILRTRTIAGRRLPVNCMETAKEIAVTLDSSLKPEEFARELLKGVVMHEMGHAMGLAHNFKGSLVYDADNATKPFSTSVMDYNHYNEEGAIFSSIDSADGMLLEYDRQIISVLYNESKDVKESDAKVAACNDEEADSTAKGIDPLCNRYDIGADPTSQALRALELFTKAGAKRGKMESITAQKVIDALIPLPPAAKITTKDELIAALPKGIAGISGTVGIYLGASANSFGYLASQSVRSLKVFQDDVLPEGMSESEMRERALQAFEHGTGMNAFPAVTKEAVSGARSKLLEYIGSTAFVASLNRDDQEKIMTAVTAAVDGALVKMEIALLSRLRTRFITALVSTPTAPLAFHERNGVKIDLEEVIMTTFEQLASIKAGELARPLAERTEALKSLKSYSRSEGYASHSGRVVTMLKAEILTAPTPLKREDARKLLADFIKVEEEKKPDANK